MRTYITAALTALALMSALVSAQAGPGSSDPGANASPNSATHDVCSTGCGGGG